MEKIAITGHTGFIGQHLVELLLKLGHVVHPISRDCRPVECDRIYHLACYSSSQHINNQTIDIMESIMDGTRKAMSICSSALFVNISSMGAAEIDIADPKQRAYNVAKLCMETYLENSGIRYVNYRLPSVYGEDMRNDGLIKRSSQGTATPPTDPDRIYYIAHVTDVVNSLANLQPVNMEQITLGQIYEQFTTRRSGLHRPTSST
jgi:nucleoside-diphosphate-sugar epimerase